MHQSNSLADLVGGSSYRIRAALIVRFLEEKIPQLFHLSLLYLIH